MTPQRRELAPRSDGARYRRVTLIVEHDGALSLNLHEMGAAIGAEWGLDDEEVTLTVAPGHVGRLALALAAELLKGGGGDLKQLSEICEANDVPCQIACWS
jgi:hypothetical protein